MSANKKDSGEKELLATIKAFDAMIAYAEDPEQFNTTSIDPVRELQNFIKSSPLTADMPLCLQFRIHACDGCPVYKHSGFRNCVRTPYQDVEKALKTGEWRKIGIALRLMLKYLENLGI